MITGLIITGIIFLINPNITIIDPLPDFIGCLLILWGISKAIPLEMEFGEAASSIKKLAVLSVIRLICIPLVIYAAAADRSFYMLAVFIFMIIEPFFVLRFFFSFFDGMSQFASRGKCQSPILYLRQIKLITFIFFILKGILNLIPDLIYLKISEDIDEYMYPMEKYRMPLLVICSILCLIAGIIWFSAICGYFRRLKKDSCFRKELHSRISSIPETGSATAMSNIKKSFAFLIAGFAVMIDLPIDGYNVIPDFIGAILICVSASFLAKTYSKAGKIKVTALIYSVFSAISLAYSYCFANRYYPSGETAFNRILGQFSIDVILSFISSVIAVLIIWQLRSTISGVIDGYTVALIESKTVLMRQGLKNRLTIAAITGTIFEILSFFGVLFMFSVPFIKIAAIAFGIYFIIFTLILFNDINTEVSNLKD